jgi:nicotinamide phosphoribosyltransferase
MIKEVYPKGFVSIVSDGFDYWKVITEYLPQLKETILNRDGRVVIRPDSGDPVKIICGYSKEEVDALTKEELAKIPEWELKGTYQLLWDIFGGTVNEYGYKVLDPHIGLIYGDSITRDRQKEIYKRLERWGFAATNLVLGVGLNRK